VLRVGGRWRGAFARLALPLAKQEAMLLQAELSRLLCEAGVETGFTEEINVSGHKFHPNTLELIDIENAIINLGFVDKYPNKCFSYEIAKATGELGNEYPSDEATRLAKQWFEEFKSTGKIKCFEKEVEQK